MTWVITGAGGMLGADMMATLTERGVPVRPLTRSDLDICDLDAVRSALADCSGVINCAAYTAVDDAQTNEADAFVANATGPSHLALACREQGVRLVHFSTDYVFAGNATQPYGEADPLAPVSAYGRTKAAGEWAITASGCDFWTIRVAWLYGAQGNCFPKTIARVARDRDTLDVVADQVGQPTWTMDVADLVHRMMIQQAPNGIYHGTSGGQASWFEFAQAVVAADGQDPAKVQPTTSEAFVRPAPRPPYSVLGHQRWCEVGLEPVGDWAGRWRAAAASVLKGI